MRSIQTARWHLVRHHFCNGLDELYDLEADPGELRNLYGSPQHRQIREQLQERLTAWQRSLDDPVLRPAGK